MKDLPIPLMKMVSGYRGSRILLTAIELDLFSHLEGGGTAVQVARELRADVRAVSVLLHALAALGLIRKKGSRFFNRSGPAQFLTERGGNDWRLGLKHHLALWESWSGLTEVIRSGRPAERRIGGMTEEERTGAFIGLMHRTGGIRAPRVAAALNLTGVKQVLDLGGGSGAYSIALARKKRDLHLTLFDRPVVLPLARKYVAEAGCADRFTFRAGDLTKDDLGGGFDLVLISSICHMLPPEGNVDLFRRGGRALVPGGMIAVHDFVLSEDRTKPLFAALFAVNMLVNTEGGNSYSVGEYREWLRSAGFRPPVFRKLPGGSDLVWARKPK